jgi:hypothetical protein
MTKDDVIKLAQEAGFETAKEWDKFPNGFVQVVARFAALVAAQEREACAKLVEHHRGDGFMARTIRARSQA